MRQSCIQRCELSNSTLAATLSIYLTHFLMSINGLFIPCLQFWHLNTRFSATEREMKTFSAFLGTITRLIFQNPLWTLCIHLRLFSAHNFVQKNRLLETICVEKKLIYLLYQLFIYVFISLFWLLKRRSKRKMIIREPLNVYLPVELLKNILTKALCSSLFSLLYTRYIECIIIVKKYDLENFMNLPVLTSLIQKKHFWNYLCVSMCLSVWNGITQKRNELEEWELEYELCSFWMHKIANLPLRHNTQILRTKCTVIPFMKILLCKLKKKRIKKTSIAIFFSLTFPLLFFFHAKLSKIIHLLEKT